MKYLKVKNWEQYQHYKNRCPPWIKLHVKILNDRCFTSLPCASRGLLMQLWVIASEYDGKVPNDLKELKYRLRDDTISQETINLLISKGLLSICKQAQADASECFSEESRGETETDISNFKYGKKVPLPKNIFLTDRMKAYIKKQGCENSGHAESIFEGFCINQEKRNMKWNDWTLAFYDWVRNDKKIYNPDKYKKYEDVE